MCFIEMSEGIRESRGLWFVFSPVHNAIVVVPAGHCGFRTTEEQTESQDQAPHDWISHSSGTDLGIQLSGTLPAPERVFQDSTVVQTPVGPLPLYRSRISRLLTADNEMKSSAPYNCFFSLYSSVFPPSTSKQPIKGVCVQLNSAKINICLHLHLEEIYGKIRKKGEIRLGL